MLSWDNNTQDDPKRLALLNRNKKKAIIKNQRYEILFGFWQNASSRLFSGMMMIPRLKFLAPCWLKPRNAHYPSHREAWWW